MANVLAPFTGAISHSGVLGRVAPARWNVVRLVGVTDTNFLFYKVVHSTTFHVMQQGTASSTHGEGNLGSRAWPGPPVLHSQGVELCSARDHRATHTAPVRNLHEEGYGSLQTEGSCWCYSHHLPAKHLHG